jgi:prolipoprotein diacylglyceryltransferase
LEGLPMGWYAILLILGFVVAIGVLNRVEFGRFD